MPHLKHPLVNLLTHLQRIAAIHKNSGLIGQHHRRPRRPREPRQPRQPFRTGGQILILVFILVRNDKRRQTSPLQLSTKHVHPFRHSQPACSVVIHATPIFAINC